MTILKATRRDLLKGAAAASLAGAFPMPAIAQGAPLKIGFMLPYTGTFAKLGKFIDDAFRLNVELAGGKLGGREVEYVQVDDEYEPGKATDNMNRLVGRDKVDVVVGTVHSGVVMAMAKIAKDTNTMLVVPNAGANDVTRAMCAPNVWRTSFTNWQPCFPMGKVMYDAGHRNIMTITWRYAAGLEDVEAIKESFVKLGGKITEELYLPFPQVEFQALITQIAQKKPDAVFAFFAGGGAVKFVKDYAAAGLKASIPLYGAGFLTDGTLEAQGADAEGLLTTLHYGDGLDNAKDKSFRAAYQKAYNQVPDVYAVQGYDAAQMLAIGLKATNGDVSRKAEFAKAVTTAKIDSPRGAFTIGASHNPVQDMYLRQVVGKDNKVIGVATKSLADPGRGCKM
jgi:branched-chain amino acid transport system substrate-binding protein